MSAHGIVQTGSCWLEAPFATSLRVVLSVNQAHEFRHGVAMVPRRSERVLHHQPPWREDDKIRHCRTCSMCVRRRRQHGEYAGVWVIMRYRSDGVEPAEIIFVGVVQAMPSDDIERRMWLLGAEEIAPKFGEQGPLRILMVLLKACDRGLEVSCIRQTVGADRAQLRQIEVTLIQLQDVASNRLVVCEVYTISNATWNDADLVWSYQQIAKLGLYVQHPVLRHDQEIAISAVECCLLWHGTSRRIDEDSYAAFHGWVASTSNKVQRMDP